MALNTPAHWLRGFADRCAWLRSEDHVFAALGDQIAETRRRLDEKLPVRPDLATHEGFVEAQNYWSDALHVRVGDLLGCAFVLAQRQISTFVALVERIHEQLEARSEAPPPVPKEKRSLLARDAKVELIDAAANYFKHRDEWPTDWSSWKNPMQKRTARMIVTAGAHKWSRPTENLVRIAAAVDVVGAHLAPLVEHTIAWASLIRDDIAADFLARGLAEDTSWWREPFWSSSMAFWTPPPD